MPTTANPNQPADVPEGYRPHPLRALCISRAVGGLMPVLGSLSWAAAQRCGRALGLAAWPWSAQPRLRTLRHLAIAFPSSSSTWRTRIAKASFLHQFVNLAELLHLRHRGPGAVLRHVDTEGWRELEHAGGASSPLLIVTGHCGNWELLAAAINALGLGMAVLGRPLHEPALDSLLVSLRRDLGTTTIARGAPGAAGNLLRIMRHRGALGLLIDQDSWVDGVWVPFFGRPAYTPVAAAELAQRFGLPVAPAFIERQPNGRHLARFLPVRELPAGPIAATAEMTRLIEDQVRRAPEQWVWMHRRWRRPPPPGFESMVRRVNPRYRGPAFRRDSFIAPHRPTVIAAPGPPVSAAVPR